MDHEEALLYDPTNWILLPPSGRVALFRWPAGRIIESARIATGAELIVSNQGRAFPWGNLATPNSASTIWRKHRIGVGGLFHTKWYVTADGRFGGAPNIPEEVPGSLRACLLLDGGGSAEQPLEENEGYATVCKTTEREQQIYRRVQLYAAEHVMADGGAIIISRLGDDGVVRVGFVGRCHFCPNAELLSFRQLCREIPDIQFKLWPEWENWNIEKGRELKVVGC